MVDEEHRGRAAVMMTSGGKKQPFPSLLILQCNLDREPQLRVRRQEGVLNTREERRKLLSVISEKEGVTSLQNVLRLLRSAERPLQIFYHKLKVATQQNFHTQQGERSDSEQCSSWTTYFSIFLKTLSR